MLTNLFNCFFNFFGVFKSWNIFYELVATALLIGVISLIPLILRSDEK